MGLTQNQDTIKTLRMVIFLIVIQTLLFMSSFIMTYAETGKDAYDSEKFPTDLKISDFKWYSVLHLKNVLDLSGGALRFNVYSSEKGGVIISGVKKGDMVALQNEIDKRNELSSEFNANQGNAVDSLKFLFNSVTFSFIPKPFNIIPIFVSTLIGLIIAYFVFTEIKSWIPDWL